MNRWPLLALVALALASCGQQAAPAAAPTDDTTGTWAMPPRLGAQALTADVNTLNYERALVATSGWGPIEVNRSNGEQGSEDGRPLTLSGVTYPTGYGVHAPSELKYSLAGSDHARCVRFQARIGVDDEVGQKGSVVFQVWGDHAKLFDSGVMKGGSSTRFVFVDLRGQRSIRLIVTDAGDGRRADHADWINPTITCVPDVQVLVPGNTLMYADTHSHIPITLVNTSRQFTGELTYHTVKALDSDAPSVIRLEDRGTVIRGAGRTEQTLSAYMPVGVHDLGLGIDNTTAENALADALVVSYQGEEVTRVALRPQPHEREVWVSIPEDLVQVRLGEPRTVTTWITITPPGETTGTTVKVRMADGQGSHWYHVEGGGTVPKGGGTIPITVTALRAPLAGEEDTVSVRLVQEISEFPEEGTNFIDIKYIP